MKTRLPVFVMAALMAAPVLTTTATAQDRADDTWFLRPHVGLSYYWGDNDAKPTFDKGDLWETTPLNLGLEIGYRFNPSYSLGLSVAYSAYGNINDLDRVYTDSPGGDADGFANEDGTRIGVQLVARKMFSLGKVAPYFEAGLGASFGETRYFDGSAAESRIAFGPNLGLGLDFFINERVSLALGTGGAYLFPDLASDGSENGDTINGSDGGFGPGDWLGRTTLGLQVNLKKFVPVMVTDLICPADVVDTGAPVTFTGSVNPDATPLVTSMWDFGDGSVANGLTASHAFSSAGTYNVAFSVSNGNGRGADSRTCVVTVEDPCEAARITSMTASNMSPDTQTSVRFSANVSGTQPATYSWNFGDGSTSSSANPSHTFDSAGTYTVTLEVTNCGGMVSRTMEITVVPYEAAICREIEEMNTVYFARNSSTLTAEARALLQENLEILQQCPNLNARLEGWAAPGERRPQQLSEDRARAVEQFYVDNGIAASRLVTAGMGRAQGLTSKKEGLAQFQRVDTIPVRN